MSNEFLIKADNICVERDKKSILKDISLSIAKDDFITIMGPNGAGKTMLLKCLMGFYRPSSGVITKKKGLRIGYVPQDFIAEPIIPISAKGFLYLRRKIDEADLRSIAQETDIEAILDYPLASLSGGELQRLLLARALLNQPEILILDEPAQNLDVLGQLAFYQTLERVHRQNHMSILIISHDLHMVMASTKKVICLFHHICCSGVPQTIANEPEFISLFGRDMAQKMAFYQHSHHHQHQGGL